MADATMNAKDAISGAMGKCYVTLHKSTGNERYLLMQATNIEAKMEKTKTEIPIMGKTAKGSKSTGWKGTGSMKIHYNTSIFREILQQYDRTGEDVYFDTEVYNNDATSDAKQQITVLRMCNLDGGILAKLDANSESLEEDVTFTFEGFSIKKSFNVLNGMKTT